MTARTDNRSADASPGESRPVWPTEVESREFWTVQAPSRPAAGTAPTETAAALRPDDRVQTESEQVGKDQTEQDHAEQESTVADQADQETAVADQAARGQAAPARTEQVQTDPGHIDGDLSVRDRTDPEHTDLGSTDDRAVGQAMIPQSRPEEIESQPDHERRGQRRPGQKSRPTPGGKARGKDRAALPGKPRFRVLQGMALRSPGREEIPDQSHLPPQDRRDLAVRVSHLSITYRTSFEKRPTFRKALARLGRGERAVREIHALKDVSFEVRTGRSVGIIGRNGAGKSTLMRAMSGILPPTSGTVEVWGRASTLLALGVGFNNSLSGRENIILGGLASGLSRAEVEARADEIADWTELGDFIDMPMRTYSSGMAGRVAFAVAVHMEPDILMIDEAMSAGDAHFKDKASAKMAELREKARAMFLVSHGLGAIKDLCDEAIWIDKGRLMERGDPDEVVDQYLSYVKAKRNSTSMEDV